MSNLNACRINSRARGSQSRVLTAGEEAGGLFVELLSRSLIPQAGDPKAFAGIVLERLGVISWLSSGERPPERPF